ncbi:MAG: UDP-N-acetylglucosamine 2-epimerase (non-hydrolyzing) [Polyangiales bacterium]
MTVVGARPQFVKAAVVSEALRAAEIDEYLVHTGQHFDANMSDVFFRELGMRPPDANLGIGGLSQGAMTGRTLEALESLMLERKPEAVLVYGDTNATLAGALAASKLGIGVAHVEAGMRSFNRAMPEELNRIVVDHLATHHFVTGQIPQKNLENEGVVDGVHVVGDVMFDACKRFLPSAKSTIDVRAYGVGERPFALVTLHRAENTNDRETLARLFDGLAEVAKSIDVIMPLHPRTEQKAKTFGIDVPSEVRTIEPVGYLPMLALLDACKLVITDSGGVQKEAFYLQRPCVTMRNETEWIETVAQGYNRLVGSDLGALIEAVKAFASDPVLLPPDPCYGDGDASSKIVTILKSS